MAQGTWSWPYPVYWEKWETCYCWGWDSDPEGHPSVQPQTPRTDTQGCNFLYHGCDQVLGRGGKHLPMVRTSVFGFPVKFLSLTTVTVLGWLTVRGWRPSCALEDGEQHPWTLPTRGWLHSPTSPDNKNVQEFPSGLAVKDLAWSLLWLGSLLWYRFYLWPGNFHMPWAQPKKKKKKRKRWILYHVNFTLIFKNTQNNAIMMIWPQSPSWITGNLLFLSLSQFNELSTITNQCIKKLPVTSSE